MVRRHIERRIWASFVLVAIAGLLILFFIPAFGMNHGMSIGEKRENFISLKSEIIGEMMSQGNYKCCLKKPCTYCIEKTPGHGSGASCNCIKDLVEGVHPCGECIGEILEGHGNPYLAEYFARAIAEKVGKEHIDILRGIVEEKYNLPVGEQY